MTAFIPFVRQFRQVLANKSATYRVCASKATRPLNSAVNRRLFLAISVPPVPYWNL